MPLSIPILTGERLILRDKIPADRENYLATGGQAEAVWEFGGDLKDVRPKTPEEADRFMEVRLGWMMCS